MGDERFVNVMFERSVNEALKEQTIYCVKRPGLANNTQPPGGAAAGRLIYAWEASTKLYTVFADDIYSGVTAIATALATTSGRVWITELPFSTGARQLVMSDGDDNYNITTADAVTQIDATDDAQYPASNTGPVVFLDGRLFQGLAASNQLWQDDLNSSGTSWTAGNYISVDTHGGPLEAHVLLKDQIIGMTKNRCEFFFNNGNPSGSVLLRIDQNTIQRGIASKRSLAWSGETIAFVSENSADGDGGRTVIMFNEGRVLDVGTPFINRFLAAEGSTISTCSALMERFAGHLCYVLNLDSAERSFVYDITTGEWTEWEAAAGSAKFPVISVSSLNGTLYGQDVANGRTYTISPTTYQDSGSNFTVLVQTGRRALNNGKPFRVLNAELLADTQASGSTALLLCGDDNTTFTDIGDFDMTANRKRIPAGGYFESSVIARLTYAANTAWRAQAIILDWEPAG